MYSNFGMYYNYSQSSGGFSRIYQMETRFFWGQPQGVMILHTKGLVKHVKIPGDLVTPKLSRRVGVDCQQAQRLFFAHSELPRLGPGKEESLRCGHPLHHRWLVSTKREEVGLPGNR